MEQRNCRARLGENGAVELVVKMMMYFNAERGTGISSENEGEPTWPKRDC
jgi:hypothetical protein